MTPPPICNPYLSHQQSQQITTQEIPESKPAVDSQSQQINIPQSIPQEADSSNMPSFQTTNQASLPSQSDSTIADYSYFTGLHPEVVRIILTEIQKELDRSDYEGSYIYDQYPDRTTLFRLALTIYDRISPLTEITKYFPQNTALARLQYELDNSSNYGQLPAVDSPVWLFHLITLLIYSEILMRRQQKRITENAQT